MTNTNSTNNVSLATVLNIIDAYEGMIRQYPINKMPADLLAERAKWVAVLSRLEGR